MGELRAQWLALVLNLHSAVSWFIFKQIKQKFGVKQILRVTRLSGLACTIKWYSDARRGLLCKCLMNDRCFVEFIRFYCCKYVLMQSAVIELTPSSEKLIGAPTMNAVKLIARSAVDRYQWFRRSFREWCILWPPRHGPCMAVAVGIIIIIIIMNKMRILL